MLKKWKCLKNSDTHHVRSGGNTFGGRQTHFCMKYWYELRLVCLYSRLNHFDGDDLSCNIRKFSKIFVLRFTFFDEQLILNFNISWISMISTQIPREWINSSSHLICQSCIKSFDPWFDPWWLRSSNSSQISYQGRVFTEKMTVITPFMFIFIWVLQLYCGNIANIFANLQTRDGIMWSLNTWEQDDL